MRLPDRRDGDSSSTLTLTIGVFEGPVPRSGSDVVQPGSALPRFIFDRAYLRPTSLLTSLRTFRSFRGERESDNRGPPLDRRRRRWGNMKQLDS